MRLTKILVVEDDPDIQAVLAVALEDIGGYTVVACTSGVEALEQANCAPDLLLLDVMMPELDGPATLQLLRTMPLLRDTPAIFLTARSQDRSVLQQDARVLGVITKPFDPRGLVEQIQTLWKGSHAQLLDRQQVRHSTNTSYESPRVALVRQQYQESLSSRISHLRTLWLSGQQEDLEQIRQDLHRLGGSGRTLGFAALSSQAHKLETAISTLQRSVQPAVSELVVQIDTGLGTLSELAQTIHEAPLEWPDDLPNGEY